MSGQRSGQATRVCEECSDEIRAGQMSAVETNEGWFCSMSCHDDYIAWLCGDNVPRRPEAQKNPTLAQVVDALEDDYDSSFDRLRDIVDEHFGLQPVMTQGDLMTFLEQRLAEQRRSEAQGDDFLKQATDFMIDLQRRGRQVHASDIGPLASMLKRAHDDGIEIGLAMPDDDDEWADRPTPDDEAIQAVFPTRSNRHDLYREAQRLVGARHGKFALLAMVNWLLHRIEQAEQRSAAAQPGPWKVGDHALYQGDEVVIDEISESPSGQFVGAKWLKDGQLQGSLGCFAVSLGPIPKRAGIDLHAIVAATQRIQCEAMHSDVSGWTVPADALEALRAALGRAAATVEETCPDCRGHGRDHDGTPCDRCNNGVLRRTSATGGGDHG